MEVQIRFDLVRVSGEDFLIVICVIVVSFLKALDCLHGRNRRVYLENWFLGILKVLGRVIGGVVELGVFLLILIPLLQGVGVECVNVLRVSPRAIVFQQISWCRNIRFDVYEVIKVNQFLQYLPVESLLFLLVLVKQSLDVLQCLILNLVRLLQLPIRVNLIINSINGLVELTPKLSDDFFLQMLACRFF